MKNPHAVALGRLGGAKGGTARAKSLTALQRQEIAGLGGAARARALSVSERRDFARSAATARWAARRSTVIVRDTPEAVRRLLKSYDPSTLRWAKADHRYAVVREILVRGDEEAKRWLRGVLSRDHVRQLVRKYAGAGCNEPERERLRKKLRLGPEAIPVRPYLGLKWRRAA